MRVHVAALLAALVLLLPSTASPQVLKSASPEAQRANQHYKRGWEAMRAEGWAEAAREFQQAIDSDPKFTLAYYSLGRAEMGLHDFAKAIDAYLKCRELYVAVGGERYTDQITATRRIEDRLLELRTALNQANQRGGTRTATQSQSLMVRELQAQIDRLEQARDRNLNLTLDTRVPYFVPLALGAAYFRSGRFADAEREYNTALEENPASGETYNNLAVLYLMTGRAEAARMAVKSAEKAGFNVNPNLKEDIEKKLKGGS
jgi:tetratricopeptide (TPR) repeat protein